MKLLKQDVTCMEKCVRLFYFEIVLFFMLKPVCFFNDAQMEDADFFFCVFSAQIFFGGNLLNKNCC